MERFEIHAHFCCSGQDIIVGSGGIEVGETFLRGCLKTKRSKKFAHTMIMKFILKLQYIVVDG